MRFEELLRSYAGTIIKFGINLQENQVLIINAEIVHRDFISLLVEEAYAVGAKFVDVFYDDPNVEKIRALNSGSENHSFLPKYVRSISRERVDSNYACLVIDGQEDPDIFKEVDISEIDKANSRHKKYFYEKGVDVNGIQWCIAAGATHGWAEKVFPGLYPGVAYSKLWDHILRITRCDNGDGINSLRENDKKIKSRTSILNSMKIRELRFMGPGTDLTVGLSEMAIFNGGSEISVHGISFQPNIPSEEIYTTPDYRKTNGTVAATRPFMVDGNIVENLIMEFSRGRLVDFYCLRGQDAFSRLIKKDRGASRLGEVALVGIDSPIFQAETVYENTLFDENAACHIALGSAYGTCIMGYDSLSRSELKDLGFNRSLAHDDIMISDESVSVSGVQQNGDEVLIISNGEWTDEVSESE